MVSLKNLKKLGVMFSLGLILWANACIAQTPTANEQLGLKFDDRKWTVGWSQTNVHSRTREWVVPGESVENWHELITDEIFYGLNEQVSPTEFMDQFIASLKKVSRTATYQVITKQPTAMDQNFSIDQITTGAIVKNSEAGCLFYVDSTQIG